MGFFGFFLAFISSRALEYLPSFAYQGKAPLDEVLFGNNSLLLSSSAQRYRQRIRNSWHHADNSKHTSSLSG